MIKHEHKFKFIFIIVAIAAFLISGRLIMANNIKSTTQANIIPGIEIKKANLSNRASYYDYDADGIKMQVIALIAKDGSTKTILNTCQVCYDSGKGYYIQVEDDEGSDLVCQNCANHYSPDELDLAKSGCNPIAIPADKISDNGATLNIDKNFLNANKDHFINWKK